MAGRSVRPGESVFERIASETDGMVDYEGITAEATYVPPQLTDRFGRPVDQWGRLIRKKQRN